LFATPAEEYTGTLFAETFNAITPSYFKAGLYKLNAVDP
jgi:hypothetical protein